MKSVSLGVLAALFLAACTAPEPEPAPVETYVPGETKVDETRLGMEGARIDIYDAALAAGIVPADAYVEKLTEDVFQWSEGPVWIGGPDGYLLFSDVPANTMYKWTEAGGVEVFLKPSGLEGEDVEGIFREPGTNGLIPGDKPGTILMGDDGNRAIARLDLATKEKTLVATEFEGARFSSPNDLALAPDGAIYFTDPPYGLKDGDASPAKETSFNGVYRYAIGPDGEPFLRVIDDSLTRPNGVVLSPDAKTLYVSVSDPDAARIYAYDLGNEGVPLSRRVFAELTDEAAEGLPGLPDGMAIDTAGRLYASGPGGIRIFAPDGTMIALISTGVAAANCTFGDDGSTLYITSGSFIARVKLSSTGLGFPR